MANPTPGQVAYTTYATAFRQHYGGPALFAWRDVLPDVQACWEAAAQAVRAWQEERHDASP